MSKLGEVLREERVRRGLSQLQLAKACHVDRSMISNYELGKDRIPHDVVCRAIKALESNKLRAQACFECQVSPLTMPHLDLVDMPGRYCRRFSRESSRTKRGTNRCPEPSVCCIGD